MTIGRSMIEVAEKFRRREARTILGVHVATQSSRFYVDYASDCTSHTFTFAVQCARDLTNSLLIKQMAADEGIQNIIVYHDKGPHFVASHTTYFWLVEMPMEHQWVKGSVKMAYFPEKHGKTLVDGHFGVMNGHFNGISKVQKQEYIMIVMAII